MSRAARAGPRRRPRLSRLPAAMASRSPALVRALRPTRAPFWSLPVVPRMAGGVARRPFGGVAGRRRPRGGSCAQVRRAAAHRRGPGRVLGSPPAAPGPGCASGTDSARCRAAQATWLQSERGAGAGVGAAVGSRSTTATPCQSARYPDADGVDTGGPPGERGGGVPMSECGSANAECLPIEAFCIQHSSFTIGSGGRRLHYWCDARGSGAGAG